MPLLVLIHCHGEETSDPYRHYNKRPDLGLWFTSNSSSLDNKSSQILGLSVGEDTYLPPEWMSITDPIMSDAIAEHSICHPGRPLPHGEDQDGSPALLAYRKFEFYFRLDTSLHTVMCIHGLVHPPNRVIPSKEQNQYCSSFPLLENPIHFQKLNLNCQQPRVEAFHKCDQHPWSTSTKKQRNSMITDHKP